MAIWERIVGDVEDFLLNKKSNMISNGSEKIFGVERDFARVAVCLSRLMTHRDEPYSQLQVPNYLDRLRFGC